MPKGKFFGAKKSYGTFENHSGMVSVNDLKEGLANLCDACIKHNDNPADNSVFQSWRDSGLEALSTLSKVSADEDALSHLTSSVSHFKKYVEAETQDVKVLKALLKNVSKDLGVFKEQVHQSSRENKP